MGREVRGSPESEARSLAGMAKARIKKIQEEAAAKARAENQNTDSNNYIYVAKGSK